MRWISALLISSVIVGASCAASLEPTGSANTALITESAPPKPKAETTKASPGEGYFWVKGHWAWKQEQWKWVGGHWEQQRPGYSWVEPRYEMQDGQHVYVVGGWLVESAPVGKTGSAKDSKTP